MGDESQDSPNNFKFGDQSHKLAIKAFNTDQIQFQTIQPLRQSLPEVHDKILPKELLRPRY